MSVRLLSIGLLSLACTLYAGPAAPDSKSVPAPEPTDEPQPWRFSFAMPAWIAWQVGDSGINGTTSRIRLSPRDTVPQLDLAVASRVEARKGRFGIMGEYSYMNLSDGIGTKSLVTKLDVRTDEHIAELALAWRLVESERGFLDVFGGVRYSNLYQKLRIHGDDEDIERASARFADDLVDRVVATVRERLEAALRGRIANGLTSLRNREPSLPQGPIGDELRGRVADRVRATVERRRVEIDAAIQSGVQERIDAAKRRLSRELAKTLKEDLNTRVSRTDDWWDPFVGFKGHYNLSKAFYLTGRADIGGFGVGSDLAWQVNAGVGCRVSRSVFTEVTYRLYDVNYRQDGLIDDTLTHGIEITTGIVF